MSEGIHFSVLVPVYNVSPYLRECIESVLTQSYGDYELLLVDDGSTDGSGAICDAYAAKDARVRVFHKENGGLMSARRYAIARMAGDYCVFLDADDWLEPNTLETLAAAIRETAAECLIYGICRDQPGGTEHLSAPASVCNRLMTDRREVLNLILNDDAFNSLCRKCAKTSCFDGRDFTPFFHIRSGEDRLQSTEILENARSFLFLPDELYHYRVNTESITHTIRYDSWRADFEVERLIHAWLEKLGVLLPADFDRLRNHLLDELVVDLKRICRFCSGADTRRAALQSILDSGYYRGFLRVGYRGRGGGLRRILNRAALYLLRRGRFGALHFFCSKIYKAG